MQSATSKKENKLFLVLCTDPRKRGVMLKKNMKTSKICKFVLKPNKTKKNIGSANKFVNDQGNLVLLKNLIERTFYFSLKMHIIIF